MHHIMSFGQRQTDGFKPFTPFGGYIELPSPSGEHLYTVPPVTYEAGLELRLYQEKVTEIQKVAAENMQAAMDAEKNGQEKPERKPLPDYVFEDDEGPTPENMLGQELLDQMTANGESFEFIRVSTETVWVDFLYGREAAEVFFNSGGDPKALADRLYGSGIDHKLTSMPTDEANTTKPRASTSGTKSQPKRKPKSTTTTKSTPKTNKK